MKRILFAAAIGLLGSGVFAADSNSAAYALYSECTAIYYGPSDKTDGPADPAAAYGYHSGAKADYKGEYRDGKLVSCNDAQYTAYLETVDPIRVMNAYPSAAGRPIAASKALDTAAKKNAQPAQSKASDQIPPKN